MDAITAKNYAAQAQRGLHLYAERLGMDGGKFQLDARAARSIAEKIAMAQHFALPDSGRIFEDNLRGIEGVEIRLPYPLITLEYFVPEMNQASVEAQLVCAPKRVVVAEEMCGDTFRKYIMSLRGAEALAKSVDFPKHDDEVRIIVSVVAYVGGHWCPMASQAVLSPSWWPIAGTRTVEPLTKRRPGAKAIALELIPLLPNRIAEAFKGGRDAEYLRQMMTHDISDEVTALLEFIEALTCSNVCVASLPQSRVSGAINARRVKGKKLPIYETKILTINAGAAGAPSAERGGTHASPRQHLRRGHIRRLPTGNIWVNSCVVGRAENGRVNKQYTVRDGRGMRA